MLETVYVTCSHNTVTNIELASLVTISTENKMLSYRRETALQGAL